MLYIHWFLLVVYLAITISGIVAVLMDNKQPEKAMAWILVLCFMPVDELVDSSCRMSECPCIEQHHQVDLQSALIGCT